MELRAGQIFFWNGGNESLLGKLITTYNFKSFARSDTTHCGLIAEVSLSKNTALIYEAGNSGFKPREVPLNWFSANIGLGVLHIGETKESVSNVLETCKKYENIGYGWLDLFLILVKHYTGISLSMTREKRLICSEAVSRVLYDCSRSIDFAKEYKIPFDLITPQHIFLSKQIKIIK